MQLDIDWEMVKMQYELFGAELKDLAEEYCISMTILEYAVENEGWEPKERGNEDGLVDNITDRLKGINALKQASLNPRYAAIESAILQKTLQIIQQLEPSSPVSASTLKEISVIFTNLREKNHVLPAQAESADGGGNRVQINILNSVPEVDGAEPQVTIVEGERLLPSLPSA